MKNHIPVLALIAIASALVAGCGEQPSSSSAANRGGQLTASDLAQLMDFHAWNVPIPEAQQPIKSIRLVVVKRDGTIVSKFDTGNNLGSVPCASILLGFSVERGTFTGHFNTRDSKGGGTGWSRSFTHTFADSDPAWAVAGSAVWNGNRAELASATKKGEMYDSILALELVK